jgi:acetyl esterase
MGDFLLGAARGAIHNTVGRLPSSAPEMAETREMTVPGAAGPLVARLFVPKRERMAAPLVFFHGGGFVVGSIGTHGEMCRYLADASGARVLAVSYRLAPEHKFPAQLDDALAAARWALSDGAAAIGAAAGAIMLGGDSAGAYLAQRCAGMLNAERAGAVRLQVLLYPMVQVDDARRGWELARKPRPLWRAVTRYIDWSVGPGACTSLLDLDHTAEPPAIMVVGNLLDPIRPDADLLLMQMREQGVPVRLLEYAGLAHGALSFPTLARGAARVLIETGEAIAASANRAAAPR